MQRRRFTFTPAVAEGEDTLSHIIDVDDDGDGNLTTVNVVASPNFEPGEGHGDDGHAYTASELDDGRVLFRQVAQLR